MSRNQITTAMSEPGDENAYLAEVEEVVRRMVGKRTKLRIHQAEDFVQYFMVWAWRRPDLREQYVPRALVSASFTQRLIDFLRQEGRQLPQGEYDHWTMSSSKTVTMCSPLPTLSRATTTGWTVCSPMTSSPES
jgi:DNA-directed RNA polymerase specialized sigma24 family protein